MKKKDNGVRFYELPIRNTPVPHSEHLPLVALRPFLSVVGVGSTISRFVLHFTQYAVVIKQTSENCI